MHCSQNIISEKSLMLMNISSDVKNGLFNLGLGTKEDSQFKNYTWIIPIESFVLWNNYLKSIKASCINGES